MYNVPTKSCHYWICILLIFPHPSSVDSWVWLYYRSQSDGADFLTDTENDTNTMNNPVSQGAVAGGKM